MLPNSAATTLRGYLRTRDVLDFIVHGSNTSLAEIVRDAGNDRRSSEPVRHRRLRFRLDYPSAPLF